MYYDVKATMERSRPSSYGGVPHGLRNAAVSAYNRYQLKYKLEIKLIANNYSSLLDNKRKGLFRTRSNVLSSADASDIASTNCQL
ncbi:UNVERIFIED_CONTAM: hypothetical protein NCL1_31974 [Trichonephila clavipes]